MLLFINIYVGRQIEIGPRRSGLGSTPGVLGQDRIDWVLCVGWSVATGFWCWKIASGLLRRWLLYYDLLPTLIRLLSLQAICWPLTHLTLQILGPDRSLLAWCVIGSTTAISNSVQLWVTSNIKTVGWGGPPATREHGVGANGVGGDCAKEVKTSKRTIQWRPTLQQSVFPLLVLSLATLAVVLLRDYFPTANRQAAFVRSVSWSPTTQELVHLPDLRSSVPVRVLLVVASDDTAEGSSQRSRFRRSSALLLPTPHSHPELSIVHRFALSEVHPTGAMIPTALENTTHGDLVQLETSIDSSDSTSEKLWGLLQWARGVADWDYVVVTRDDVFVRMDVVGAELAARGRVEQVWRGGVVRYVAFGLISPIDALLTITSLQVYAGGAKQTVSPFRVPTSHHFEFHHPIPRSPFSPSSFANGLSRRSSISHRK